ncbi:MAG: metalloregulator ArsR/SmtB family transcription factor [Candidatus Saccharimonadales bacterium]
MINILTKSPKSTETDIAKLFDGLGDPTRLKIVCLLLENGELCVSDIKEEIGISMPGTSQQLRVLENAGLLKRLPMGQKACYIPNHSNPQAKLLFSCIKTLKKG